MKNVKLNVYGEEKVYPQGITYLEIAEEYQCREEYNIVLAKVNGVLKELTKKINEDQKIEFITTNQKPGYQTYTRSVSLLMMKSFEDVLGKENIDVIRVELPHSKGHFCSFKGKVVLTQDILDDVKKRMLEIAEEDIPIRKESINTEKAVELFKKANLPDSSRLFSYRRSSRVNIYRLGDYVDYYFSYLVPSTKYLKYYDLFLYEDGFVLQLPSKEDPEFVGPIVESKKIYETITKSSKWVKKEDIDTVGGINKKITQGAISDIIQVQEALQEKNVADIAHMILERSHVKFVMIAGPSSSGKTTFSHRLAIQMRSIGLKPHLIGVDDYFKNRDQTPVDENGMQNFECLEALDTEQFNIDMTNLANGETVQIPSFNFITGKREYKGNFLKLDKGDILIIEGIHSLNDEMSYSLPRDSKFKIYISALTQVNICEHNRIPTTDGRLIRRMVRDARMRGTDARGTIERWQSVRNGEEQYIFPYQEDADVMFNSALVYELSVLKQYAEPLLFSVPRDCNEYVEAKRLLKFFDFFLGVDSRNIPTNSLLREFIGGSCFEK